ncbi:MAG TPA: DUF1015 domain-containing protein [Thermoanaerobaculia bacterium]|nr:DUF1015 domain-containing protein [Thermoanaerobaculia bacterium]
MRLYAFQGLRYGRPARDIDSLIAPPYDQIDEGLRDRLQALSPHHFAWLIKPVPGPAGDPYQEAARLHAEWLASGVVVRDEAPSLYPYVIELAEGGSRLGLCCLAGIEEPETGIIRAHEATLDKPLADRVSLLEATRVDLEPVFFLSDDGGELDRLLLEDVGGQAPVALHQDPEGNRHLLYRVADPQRIARYRALLAPLPVAIADGHHRYKTGHRFARSHGAQEGTAAAAKLTVVTSIASPGLAIDPIHRALEAPVDLSKAAGTMIERRPVDATSGPAFAAAVAAAPQPALGVWTHGGRPEIWRLDPAKAPAHLAPGARELAVTLLHEAVLPALGFAPESATDGTIVYRSSPEKLATELAAGTLAVGLFLPPMLPEAFSAAIAHGDLLPPKSTRFLPKVFAGLVWAGHDSLLG